MTKKQFLARYELSEAQFDGTEKISGSLDLSSVTSIPAGFNPTVGGDLDLRSVTSIPAGFNPTVGGSLDLSSERKYIGKTVPPVVIARPKITQVNKNFYWEKNGFKYALIDGIFCEILREKQDTIKGETYNISSAKKVNREEHFFIANKGLYYAHNEDLRKAFEDLEFKIVAEKLKSEPITKDTIITVRHYRLVTGACEMGVRDWMKRNNITTDEIKASELLPLLQKTNAYGFERFKALVNF